MLKPVAALAALAIAVAPSAQAFPIVGAAGLCPNAQAVVAYVQATYPAVLSIGGVRQDPIADHPSGHAVDIIVGGNTTLGNQIEADLMSQAGRFGIKYLIWQQTQYTVGGGVSLMANRGSATANHRDHIHTSVF